MNIGGVVTPNNYLSDTQKANKYIQKHTNQTIDVNERNNYQIPTPNAFNNSTA